MQEKIKAYWQNKSTWNKISDVLFIALIVTLLIPEGRMAFGGFVNRVKAMVLNPSVQTDVQILNDSDYNWQLTDLEGGAVDLKDYKGKVVFLNLWATWCPPCVGEMPEIQELYDHFKDNDQIAFLLVSNESTAKVQSFIDKREFTFPVFTTQQRSPEVFATRSIPTTFIISKNGQIKVRETGAYNWGGSKTKGIIEELLKE
jgi:peroxiredoxin